MTRKSRRTHSPPQEPTPPRRPEPEKRTVPWSRRLLAGALWASALFLFAAALPVWPAQYDGVLRIVVCASALFAAYAAYDERRTGWVLTLGLVAVTFNPIWPLGLSRGNWVAANLVAGLIFVSAAARFGRSPRGIFRPAPRIP